MEIIQRVQSGISRKCLLEKLITENFDWNTIPSHLQICSECHTHPSTWYITAIKQPTLTNTLNGLTNGVFPGFKCTACKESFLRQYLQPNWIIDSSSASLGDPKKWQTYGLISLSHPILQQLSAQKTSIV